MLSEATLKAHVRRHREQRKKQEVPRKKQEVQQQFGLDIKSEKISY